MKLIFLGSGSAFTVGDNNYQSNMILESQGHNLLIDCGTDIRFSLHEAQITYDQIEAVFISHLHSDHVGGLEWLAFCTHFHKPAFRPKLYISRYLINDLWKHVLSGGLSTLEEEDASLHTFFDVIPLEEKAHFNWYGIDLQLIRTFHVVSNHLPSPSYGLIMTYENSRIFLTADTKLVREAFQEEYEKADLIFHDCETALQTTGVHATYKELLQLEPGIRKKMWLYHHNPGPLPQAEQDGFLGFVEKGQSFKLKLK